MTPREEWRPVVGWEGVYDVSDLGRVRSLDRIVRRSDGQARPVRGRVLRQTTNGRYPLVHLALGAKQRSVPRLVHRLVARAFIGPCPPGFEVLHGPDGRAENSVGNLRYDTHAENFAELAEARPDLRLVKQAACSRDHLKAAPNLTGRGQCLACERMGSRRTYARKLGHPFDPQAISDAYYESIMRGAA